MVKIFSIIIGILILILSSGSKLSYADARSVDKYKDLIIDVDMDSTVRKNKQHVVVIKLINPETSNHVIRYIVEKETEEGLLLPISFEIKNIDTGEVIKTPEPSTLIFFYGLQFLEWPKEKRGRPLRPGEEVSSRIDIKEYVVPLHQGNYELTPIIWLPSKIELRSNKSYPITVIEE